MARIQFEIPEEQLKTLDKMQSELGLKTRTDLFNNAMSLLRWIKAQEEQGNRVTAFDEKSNVLRELTMPMIDRVRQSADDKNLAEAGA